MRREAIITKEDQAKYPFLEEAANFVESLGIVFQELSSNEYPSIMARAVQWVKENIEGRIFITDKSDPDTDVLAYPLALAFIFGLKKDWVINRFATWEQKRIDLLLKNEKDDSLFIKIAKQGFSWDLEPVQMTIGEKKYVFALPFRNYLEVAPQLHSADWKLVNRYVEEGKVGLRRDDVARILSEAAKSKILNRAKTEEVKKFELPDQFKPYLSEVIQFVEERKGLYDENAPLTWIAEARPPCIIAIVNDLEAGRNLSHMARFTITTFMVNVGKSVDDVLELFSRVADFDESKARYQVEHIAGQIGSKTKYNVPKCDVLRSFGLCVNANQLCEDIWHPLTYYKRRIFEIQNQPLSKREGQKNA